jgi:hypothetical protein
VTTEHDEALKKFLAEGEERNRKLDRYLDEAATERAHGITLRNVVFQNRQIIAEQKKQSADHRALVHEVGVVNVRLDRHGREIKELKRIVEYEGELDTGQHDPEDVKREVERQLLQKQVADHAKVEGETIWWKRNIVQWIVGGVAFCIVQAITFLVALAVAGHSGTSVQVSQPPPQPLPTPAAPPATPAYTSLPPPK